MKYLLDTNALIGLLFRPDFLSDSAISVLLTSENLSVSIASLWEIGIKKSIGKLELDATAEDISNMCTEMDVRLLNLSPKHIDVMCNLEKIHKDPFDRIIISQAIEEEMILITSDTIIPQYKGLKTLW